MIYFSNALEKLLTARIVELEASDSGSFRKFVLNNFVTFFQEHPRCLYVLFDNRFYKQYIAEWIKIIVYHSLREKKNKLRETNFFSKNNILLALLQLVYVTNIINMAFTAKNVRECHKQSVIKLLFPVNYLDVSVLWMCLLYS